MKLWLWIVPTSAGLVSYFFRTKLGRSNYSWTSTLDLHSLAKIWPWRCSYFTHPYSIILFYYAFSNWKKSHWIRKLISWRIFDEIVSIILISSILIASRADLGNVRLVHMWSAKHLNVTRELCWSFLKSYFDFETLNSVYMDT